jgi:MFS transporter, ACS family, tartrate transporter
MENGSLIQLTRSISALTDSSESARLLRRVGWRILPLVFALYIVAYLDRANVAFAKLTMATDLNMSEAAFGFGAALFFAGYLFLEIPGALIAERWSARLWISRILFSWGAATVLLGFVRDEVDFYIGRFLLGMAEAGFFPAVIVYLTHWFPQEQRARALSWFVVAIPFSLVIGAPVSGALLTVNWLGLPGWRWVFILEGLPAILLGFVALRLLVDRPAQAKWLRPAERTWLEQRLEAERAASVARGRATWVQGLREPFSWLLALALMFANIGVVGYILWLPTRIYETSGLPPAQAVLLSALPYVAAMAGMLVCGRSSDRRGERTLHTAGPMVISSLLLGATAIPRLGFTLSFVLLCLTGGTLFAWAPAFWALPATKLTQSAAAAAIGFINTVGNVGGFVGPLLVGRILSATSSFAGAAMFLSLCLLASALLTWLAARQSESAVHSSLSRERRGLLNENR